MSKTYPEILDDPQVAHLELVRDLALPNGAATKTTAFPLHMSDYRFEVYRHPPNWEPTRGGVRGVAGRNGRLGDRRRIMPDAG